MDYDGKAKNYFSQQDISTEEKSLKIKIFYFFYAISKEKQIKLYTFFILIILEMIQLISYAFDEPHKNLWKINESNINNISDIVGATRILSLMKFLDFNIYIVVFFILIVLIFCLFLIVIMEILFGDPQSKLFTKGISVINFIINPLAIFLYIPITELILLPLKCKDGKIDIVQNGATCYENLHYLYLVLGIIGSVLLLICNFFLLSFYFSPFQYYSTTLRVTSINDLINLVSKFIFIYRYIKIKNQYISILILLLFNLFVLINEFYNHSYNNFALNIICSIRNISVCWTYFILLIAKILEDADINGLIYLLLFGYPIIIYCFLVFFNYKTLNDPRSDNADNINNYLLKTRFQMNLIDSFLDNNKNVINNNNIDYKINETLLKGSIQKHIESCLREDCPLTKFVKNPGNNYIQKQCLLNYMNSYFELGIKKYPQNTYLIIYYIQFNYSKRYNLNSVRTNLSKLKTMKKNINEEYIIFCIEQNVKKMKNKINDNSDNNEQELEKDLMEQKFQRLKYLIENSTKLYGEFWGIFATNITTNLNTLKLYTLGEKLNIYLNEITSIWENDIKSKRIDIAHQGIAQLYCHFLKEILWNKKKSDEISKKLNEEHHHLETKKVDDDNFHGNNLEAILENQDYIFICNSNEKGKCTIIQCSNSIINLLGYEKSEIIGKNIEILMPSILIEQHINTLDEYIKNLNTIPKEPQDFNKGNDNKQIFLLPKNKMGYILPFVSKFFIYDDNDFSNSYIIKSKLESKDPKGIYGYYILAKSDYTINCISSSALHLGLTMDLLKKYMIRMDVLLRTSDDRKLKLDECIDDFEEQEKEITWVYPELIYPKNNMKRKEASHLDNMIKFSRKKHFILKVTIFRNKIGERIAFCFRLTEKNKNILKYNKFEMYIPKVEKEFLFDILTLHYIRTMIVDNKSGLKNLREKEEDISYDIDNKNENFSQANNKSERRKNKQENLGVTDDEDDEEKKKEIVLTKEKLNEIQGESCDFIKDFIFNLTFYGRDVQLEKHGPNKEIYPVGKIQEPHIKILVANFNTHIQKRNGAKPFSSDGYNNNLNDGDSGQGGEDKKLSEDLNREFTSDTSTSLSNIFNAKSITYIKLISLFIFIVVIFLITLEFIFTFIHLNDIRARIEYLEYGYHLLSNMVYTKYFISEAVFAHEIPERFKDNDDIYYYYNETERKIYVANLKRELADYLVLFNRLLNNFNSATITLSKEYTNFTGKANMSVYTITISDNGERESNVYETFSAAMRRIPSDVFYISSNIDPNYSIDMKNQNCYELMQNILNVFYTTWKQATIILLKDVKAHCLKSALSYIILVTSFLITIICLIMLYKLLMIFSSDREKPINLFLTIKKKIFEELKNASEGFSNKLLNKFFGNEENEEEAQQDYQTNIKPNDINIIKFKSPNEYKLNGNKDRKNILIFIKMTVFLIFCNAYMVFKFCYSYQNIQNISKFTDVFDIMHTTHTNIILSIDVLKSFLFNNSIPIFNHVGENEILHQFLYEFYNESNSFEETILATSKSDSFLDNDFKYQFYDYLYNDYSELVKSDLNDTNLIEKYDQFNPILNRLFENLKFMSLKYLNYGYKEKREEEILNNEYAKNGYPSEIICDSKWIEINELTTIYIRSWFKNILGLMTNCLDNYVNQMKLIHITIFIVLIVFVCLAYCIVWKSYENKLRTLLKRSFNLINLIPEEIKYMIVSKLNE